MLSMDVMVAALLAGAVLCVGLLAAMLAVLILTLIRKANP